MKKGITFLLIGASLLTFSCKANSQKSSEPIETVVNIPLGIVNVSAVEFQKLFQSTPGIILDVRTPGETQQGHLEGASFVNYYDPDFAQKTSMMQKDNPIFIYCRSGARSAQAAKIMSKNGFGTIYNLNGGIGAWEAAGFKLIREKGQSAESSPEISLGDFKKLLKTDQPVLVDFHTQWCAPCKKMSPVVDKLKKEFEGSATILKIDADKSKALAQHYEVKGVPAFVIFKNGKEVWRKTGAMSESELRGFIEQYTKK